MPTKEETEQMIQKCMKDKGWTRERCQSYVAGGIWGSQSEMTTPTVEDVHVPRPLKVVKEKKKGQGQTFEIIDVPIFKTGEWKDRNWTLGDLDEIADNTNKLIQLNLHEPPVKLGHSENQEILEDSGMPAVGWIERVKRIGNQLFVDVKNVPKKILELLEKRAYKKVSAEVYEDFKHPETKKSMGKVLRAVAFLGADIPEIKGLGDILGLYDENQLYTTLCFTERELREVNEMNEKTLTRDEIAKKCKFCAMYMDWKGMKTVLESDVSKFEEWMKDLEWRKHFVKKMQEEQPKCPEGFNWDEAQQRCVPVEQQTQENPKPTEDEIKKAIDILEKAGYKVEKTKQKQSVLEIPENVKEQVGDIDEDEMFDITEKIQKELNKDEITKTQEKPEVMKLQLPGGAPRGWDRASFESAFEALGGTFTSCVREVADWAENPEKYCAWMKYRATGEWPGTAEWRAGESENKEVQKLQEEINKLKNEKLENEINFFVDTHKEMITPAIEDKVRGILKQTATSVIKFDEKDVNLKDEIIELLDDIYSRKIVIFEELAKQPSEEATSSFTELREKFIQKYDENVKITNLDVAIQAEQLSRKENIPYKEALFRITKQQK